MSKDYIIYTDVDPGPALIELTARLIEPLNTIKIFRFVAWDDQTESQTGVFIPSTKTVIIDLGNILNNYDFHRMGMLYTAGVWYTALWTIFHEIIHGRQVEADPGFIELIEKTTSSTDMQSLAKDYERAVMITIKDLMQDYVINNPLPPLDEWGWLGEKVIGAVNDLYAKGDTRLIDEIDALKQGAVAGIPSILVAYKFSDPRILYEEIDKGHLGLKLNGNHYLTAPDFFGLDEPVKTIADSAPTIFME